MICTLSKHEAEKQGYTDSLMLDHEGNVAEATGANIFFKDKKGELHTPIPDSFLDGITCTSMTMGSGSVDTVYTIKTMDYMLGHDFDYRLYMVYYLVDLQDHEV